MHFLENIVIKMSGPNIYIPNKFTEFRFLSMSPNINFVSFYLFHMITKVVYTDTIYNFYEYIHFSSNILIREIPWYIYMHRKKIFIGN